MKRFLLSAILIILLFIAASAQSLRIATFNLRFANTFDTGNLWKDRQHAVYSLIRFHDFDVFGTQEGLAIQLNDIVKNLPEYARYGKGRDDGSDMGEHSAIFYKKNKYRLLSNGDFWLSETPANPGKGWDATCCNRICSWVQLQDIKNNRKFYFFNAHFDHQGQIARRESAKLVLQKIKEIAGSAPAIFCGDLNASRDTEPYQILKNSAVLHDSYYNVKYPYENNTSFNGFGADVQNNDIIDHIFLTKTLYATKWGVLTDTYHGKFPSDHFPVMAVIDFLK